jgi:two-component system KDP operon response regulator KdpE
LTVAWIRAQPVVEPRSAMVVRVLVVDDDPDILRLERRILQAHGYDVTPAVDGVQALADIEQNPPDLILTDLALLRWHGRELRDTLASGARRTALLVSSVADEGPAGVPFLRRPFALTELLHAVEDALHSARP